MLGLLAVVACEAIVPTNVIQTKYGPVQGKVTDYGQSFLGIRYAAAPERWTAPKPPAPWKEVQQVVKDAPGCYQNCSLPIGCPTSISEDCLFLNVITPPATAGKGPFPVYVFIHGGNFRFGCGSGDMINAEYMAGKKNVVFVGLNYRLGVWGFLATMSGGIDGNFGILDQRLALQWVKDNIANFGGDPSRVTLGGQSAGAQSVGIHMIDPASAGLFHQASMESNPWGAVMRTSSDAVKLATQFADILKCKVTDGACLRKAPIASVLAAQQQCDGKILDPHFLEITEPWGPVVNTSSISLTKQPVEYFGAGQFRQMPTLLGTTSQEAILFIYELYAGTLTKSAAEALLIGVFKLPAGKQVIDKYALSSLSGDTRQNVSQIATDFVFMCPTRYATRRIQAPTYLYQYGFLTTVGEQVWGPNFKFCWDAVCHGSEVPMVLHTAEQVAKIPPFEILIEENVSSYWSNFVHTGNPNEGPTKGLSNWPVYSAATDPIMLLNSQQTSTFNLRKDFCDFWDVLGYVY